MVLTLNLIPKLELNSVKTFLIFIVKSIESLDIMRN